MIKARPVAGDIAGGRSLPRRAAALCLAQIHGLCGDRRRPFDQAPDPCAQGPWRDRGQGPQRQARPRRHPRDRVLRADPAADRRRPLPRPARPRDRADADGARRARLDHRRGARRADRAILVPAPRRACHPDGRRRADAYAAGGRCRPRAHRPHAGLCRCATPFRRRSAQSLQTVERHYAALFETAPQLSAGIGNLVFTGDVDDPDTLQTLATARLQAAERHLPGHPRLAFRPLPRDAIGRGARAADRTDAGAAAAPSARPAAPTRR